MYRNQKTAVSGTLKNKHSPATSYWLSTLEETAQEKKSVPLTSKIAKVAKAFASLEDIFPHCGIYSPILKIISDELKGAVYSDIYTTSTSLSDDPVLEKVPYFELLQRLQNEKEESKEVFEELEDRYKSKICQYKEHIKEQEEKNSKLREDMKQITHEKEKMEEEINKKNEEIKILEKKLTINQHIAEDQIIHLSLLNEEVEQSKGELQADIEELRRYKLSYHTLKDTFDLPPDKRPRRGFRRPIISTKKTRLLSSIEAASKLEQQMVEVQSKSLEEYDLYLEDVKTQLCMKKYSENENDHEFFIEELQLETLKDEMKIKLRNFQRLISGIESELELVRQHRDTLQSQLSRMEQAENMAAGDAASNAGTLAPSSMAGGPGSSHMMVHEEVDKKTSIDSQISFGSRLEEDTTQLVDPTSDPFNPQEKLLSKYSAMLYTSTNAGKTFEEVSIAQFCVSCSEKTVVCPHKVTKSDLIISLPQNCSHIKVSRPSLRLTISNVSQTGLPDAASNQDSLKWYATNQRWTDADNQVDLSVRRQLAPLWQDAKRRAGIDAGGSSLCASRDLNKDRVNSILEQFFAKLLWDDDHPSLMDHVTTIREHLYHFMNERYSEEEISTVATYDLITGIVKYAEQDKIILLLGYALAGLVDGSAIRYVLLVADLIAAVCWESVSDFRHFTELLYPFLDQGDVDHFVLEFHAFAENKISQNFILNYIIHVITKNKEPRMINAETKLATCPMKERGQMTKEEYIAAMEGICPLANDQLLWKLTQECMLSIGSKVVPIKRLAFVTAYTSLLQVWQLLKSQLPTKMEECRRRDVEESLNYHRNKVVVSERGPVLTMSQVKQLASNISRLRHTGTSSSQQSFYDDMY